MSDGEQSVHGTDTSAASCVGPITVGNRNAERLRGGDDVIVFRDSERTVGATWWRETRTGEKQGDCVVEFVSACNPGVYSQLHQFISKTRFTRVSDWQEDIQREGVVPDTGFLYRVYQV